MCSMVCDNQEIKVLLMGGFSDEKVLSDCWLLDVKRGNGEKVRKKRERNTVRIDAFPLICCHRSCLMVRHCRVVGVILLAVSHCWMAQ